MAFVYTGQSAYDSDAIPASALGDEFLGWGSLGDYEIRQDNLNSNHTRWPGGIPSEDGMDFDGDGYRETAVFSLANPELMEWDRSNGTPREGLGDVLASAVGQGNSFSLVAPLSPYVETWLDSGDEAAFEMIRSEVSDFVDRICAGEFGETIPSDFVIELGSEYYATQTWRSAIAAGADPDELAHIFGSVSAVMADAFQDAVDRANATGLNDTGFNPVIAVQLGRLQSDNGTPDDGSPADNHTFIQAFSDLSHSGEVDLSAIDAVIWHRYNPRFEAIDDYVYSEAGRLDLQEAIADWQDLAGKDLALVVGWATPDITTISTLESSDVVAERYGPIMASSILQQFSVLADSGMDYGSVFGTDIITSFQVGMAGGKTTYFGGQLYGMMAESLAGTHLLAQPGADEHSGGIGSNTAAILDGVPVEDSSVNLYAFEDDQKVVVFLAAKDFPGSSLPYNLDVQGAYSDIEITTLSAEDRYDAVGSFGTIEADPRFSNGVTSLDLTFDTDYEVIRVVMTKDPDAVGDPAVIDPPPPEIPDTADPDITRITTTRIGETLHGGAGDDTIEANHRGASISGWNGDDLLIAHEQNVYLWGNTGNDTLISGLDHTVMGGGDGNDLLMLDMSEAGHLARGGEGMDVFDITTGPAEATSWLADFDPAQDVLIINGAQVDLDHLDQDMSLGQISGAQTLTVGSSTLVFAEPDALDGGAQDSGSGPPADTSHDDDSAEDQDDPSSGSCFVASAAYGDLRHRDVVDLRGFRDNVLLPHPVGRIMIRIYWRIGPAMARHIDSRARSGRAARAAISAIIGMIRAAQR